MSDFKTTNLDSSPLDPRKRVRYTTGLVMGVDEFQQDQLYFMERDHLHQRSLHGYGVVSGLGIETRENSQSRWEVVVAPGLAVTPRGQTVCVDQPQCANLDDWLDRHEEELTTSPPQIPGQLPLWVVLCPRDCETDPMPVLGDPCRTEEDSTVPSRIVDDFELRLSLEPPEQLEEEAVQRFGDLLRSFVIAESASPFLDQAAVEDLVRGLLPSSPPLPLPTSPPEPLYLPADEAAEILAAAWRVWVTEVRPRLADGAEGCAGGGERCIALGRLDVDVQDNDGTLEVASADLDVTEVPFLLHTRVIQEWLTLALRPPRHGDLLGLDDDDHLQYLLVSPAEDPADRSLIADLNANGNRVVGLPAAEASGQAVPYQQAVKTGDPAGSSGGNNLGGNYPFPKVIGLQGRSVSATAPNPGNVLVWNGSAWTPQAPAAGGGVPDLVESDLTRINGLSWNHGQPAPFQLLHDFGTGANAIEAIAVSFGKKLGDAVPLDPGTVETLIAGDPAIRLWVRQVEPTMGFFLEHLQVPMVVEMAEVVTFNQGLIEETRSAASDTTSALVLYFPDGLNLGLFEDGVLFRLEILGDHILDFDGRAVDVEFVRSVLPTGDRAEGAGFGIQGGYFESWFTFQATLTSSTTGGTTKTVEEEGTTPPIIVPPEEGIAIASAEEARLVVGDVDLNRATAKDLQTLSGVGPALAKRIVAERKAGGEFTSLEDLRRVSGISDNLIDRLRKQQDGES